MKFLPKIFLILLFIAFSFQQGRTQNNIASDTVHLNKKRLYSVIAAEALTVGGSLYLLNNLWYKDYPRSSFHFFNDNKEWLQMDKLGHATTSCTIGALGYYSLKWCGVENKKAIWYGGGLGSVYLLTIEVLDGLSSEWGFSLGDFTANTFGSFVFMSQQLAWNEQRIIFKWSYHNTKFADIRPDLLGSNLQESVLKDYNGQTYWLSGNIHSFMKKDSRFPKWLNVAIGYGAEGMIGGYENPSVHDGVIMPEYNRYRQFYLSPDIDFTRIPTKSKFLKLLFYSLDFIKIPAPTLGFSKENNFRFHLLYF
ncbi:MAG: DUF2279 domain-containing protein [Bacteroidota bacterium]